MMPSETSGRPKRAVFEAVRSVQASASSQPPPSAKPLTIAIEGLVMRSRRPKTCWPKKASSLAAIAFGIATSSLMSAPATKAFSPEPVITRQRTAASDSSASKARASSVSVSWLSALSLSGRLTVSRAMPFEVSSSRFLKSIASPWPA